MASQSQKQGNSTVTGHGISGPVSKLTLAGGLALILMVAGAFWLLRPSYRGISSGGGIAAAEHFKRGIELANSGNNKGAEEAFQTAIALSPGYAPAHFAIADLYDSAGRPALGAEKLKALRGASPDTPHVDCRRAELYLKADGFEKVIKTARAELERDPKCALGNSVMGMALMLAGDSEGAVTHLTRAHDAAPQDGHITRTLAQVMGQAGRASDGTQLAKALVKGENTPPEDEYVFGWLLMQSCGTDHALQQEALKHLTKAVSLAPEYGAASGAMGTLLSRMGMAAEAFPFLDKARKANALDLDSARALARVSADLKRPDAASLTGLAKNMADFDVGIRNLRLEWLKHPDDLKNTLALAEREAKRGDVADAKDMVITVLKEDPNQPEALRILEGIVARK